MEPAGSQCGVQPSFVFLLVTILVTASASAMLCAAIMTDHWEYITWDRGKLEMIAKQISNSTPHSKHHYSLEWLLDGKVARVLLESRDRSRHKIKQGMYKMSLDEPKPEENLPALFFVPVHGGIWTLCFTLDGEEEQLLGKLGFPQINCTNYLNPDLMREEGARHWQHRMQNLSISCALVCLIILGSSALVGAFGVMKHQISAVLVTGVMYLLAATFAMFTLTIIHFKRAQSRAERVTGIDTSSITIDGVVLSTVAQIRPYYLGKTTEYFSGRIFTTGWSLHLGWGGVGMCILVSLLWILLSKIMRYNPLSALLTVL